MNYAMENDQRLGMARKLMGDFAQRTALSDTGGSSDDRYLWTDAFAVQTFFALAHTCGDDSYRSLALKLISEVHQKLGRFHFSDPRKGWISGLSEELGQQHPTVGGLRIGKKLSERGPEDPFHENLEWERDGQYFHYLTRWIKALLSAAYQSGESKYTEWAAELMHASSKFVYRAGSRIRMYWKMSIDLSRPLVNSMGAHDPLEGLICALTIAEALPGKAGNLSPLIHDLEECCKDLDWTTSDPLGIGILLLNVSQATDLDLKKVELPATLKPAKLLADCMQGLEFYARVRDPRQHASQRLAFRECGLSLGLRVLMARNEESHSTGLNLSKLGQFVALANEIEDFWTDFQHHHLPAWLEHQNINTVMLAASLVAPAKPQLF